MLFIILPDEHWLLVVTVLFRTLLVVALSIEYGFTLFDVRLPRVVTLQRRASAGLLICLTVALLVLLYPLGRAYRSSRYAREEYRPVMELLQAQSTPGQAGLILTDQAVYQRFYPFLRGFVGIYLSPEDDKLSALTMAHDELWVFGEDALTAELRAWLDDHTARTEVYEFGTGDLYRYHVREE